MQTTQQSNQMQARLLVIVLFIGSLFFWGISEIKAQCTVPPDQNFGSYNDPAFVPAITYECITYTGGGTNIEVAISNDQGYISVETPVISPSCVFIGGSVQGGYAELKTANGNNFKMVSFNAEFWGHSNGNSSEIYNVVGYRDGAEVVRANNLNIANSSTAGTGNNAVLWNRYNFNANGSNSGTLTFGTNWGNIDQLRMYVADAAPNNWLVVVMDNLNFEPPVTALPVMFDAISASIVNKHLNIIWNTVSETNNDHFEIQLSKDGTNFSTFSTIKSKALNGNSLIPLEYSVTIDIPQTGIMAIGFSAFSLFFFILVLTKPKKLWGVFLFFVFAVSLFGCYKSNNENVEANNNKIFFRIMQVDKDGGKLYSKVFKIT